MEKGLFDLSGKVSLITGGNGGIGLGMAKGLASCGSDIAIWGRNEEKNESAKNELSQYGTKVNCYAVDVSLEEEVKENMKFALKTYCNEEYIEHNQEQIDKIQVLAKNHVMGDSDLDITKLVIEKLNIALPSIKLN